MTKTIDGTIKPTYNRKEVRFYTSGEGDWRRTTAVITIDGYNYSCTEFNLFRKRTIKAFLIKQLEQMANIVIE